MLPEASAEKTRFRKIKLDELKKILPDIRGEEEFVRLFLDEAKITAQFTHPNIAHVYDLDIIDGELILALELPEGGRQLVVIDLAKGVRLGTIELHQVP